MYNNKHINKYGSVNINIKLNNSRKFKLLVLANNFEYIIVFGIQEKTFWIFIFVLVYLLSIFGRKKNFTVYLLSA